MDQLTEWIEGEIAKHEREVYGEGEMPARAKEVLRALLRKEDDFWSKADNRVDSNTGHDDQ